MIEFLALLADTLGRGHGIGAACGVLEAHSYAVGDDYAFATITYTLVVRSPVDARNSLVPA